MKITKIHIKAFFSGNFSSIFHFSIEVFLLVSVNPLIFNLIVMLGRNSSLQGSTLRPKPCNAGIDTTAEAMQWAIAELINHPDALKELREEIGTVVGETGLVEETDIPSLPYLQTFVEETLYAHQLQ